MSTQRLPSQFLTQLRELEASYVRESDPIRQSGFAGGPARWRLEREPILEPILEDGDILDIGCANGFLLESLVAWARERGISLTPFGVDHGSRLIALARQRLPEYAEHFYVGNAWDWKPHSGIATSIPSTTVCPSSSWRRSWSGCFAARSRQVAL